MNSRVWSAAWVVAGLVTACTEYSVDIKPGDPPLVYLDSDTDVAVDTDVDGLPELVFSPPVIDFGYVEEGTTVSADVLVTNLGDAPLAVADLLVTGSSTFSLADAADLSVAVGSTELFTVQFTPENADVTGAVTFTSSDPYAPTAQVELLGTGANRAVQGSPNPLSFGDVVQGDSQTERLELVNTGNAPVTVTSVASNDAAFVPRAITAPVTIPVGSSYQLPVVYTPQRAGAASGLLSITSDARYPAADVMVNASGVADRPTAVCSVNPTTVVAIHESATWRGNQSTDPNGRPLTYSWSLITRPAGSVATMPGGSAANRGPFTPDVVGDYVGRLIVSNDLGAVSDPCDVTLHAEPNASLWVEMFWQHSGDDMDLHLIANAGSRNSTSDCYYANCVGGGPNWGVAGTADNPFLDLDDIPGTGPENINIARPADGTYRVDVHDYPGSTYNGNNQVRVRVYIDGILLYDQIKVVSGESSWTSFARIVWSGGAGTVVPL
ncbi:MAG: choice-of-anchor D domain-containing protein [Alphaproteobacteria bacterium]|nr:choice-of-anchor D domain-containing protein [Alphaproteobacteria bacterium]